jgi:hypothetical protein
MNYLNEIFKEKGILNRNLGRYKNYMWNKKNEKSNYNSANPPAGLFFLKKKEEKRGEMQVSSNPKTPPAQYPRFR